MLFKSVLALSALAGTVVLAQNPDCVSAANETFQFCFDMLDGDFQIYWNNIPENNTVDILYEADDNGWKGFGFSSAEGREVSVMVGSNVVMGCFSGLTADAEHADYALNGRTTSSVASGGLQELISYSQMRENGLCSIRFTRLVAPPLVPATQRLSDRPQKVVAARGGAELAPHPRTQRQFFDVNFATGEVDTGSSLLAPKVLVTFLVASVVVAMY